VTTTDPICVVGLSAFTAVGYSAAMTVAAVRAGISMHSLHPFMVNLAAEPYKVCTLPPLDAGLAMAERLTLIARETTAQLLALLPDSSAEIDLLLGLPSPRPGLPDALESLMLETVESLEGKPSALKLFTAAKGYVSGVYALRSAINRLQSGAVEFCLVAGVDSYMNADTLLWLEMTGQLYTQENPWGFIPGEAGAGCLVCRASTAQAYGLPVLAQLKAATVAVEPDSDNFDKVCTGRGLSMAVEQALEQLPPEAWVDNLLCDTNGQAYRTDELGFMLARHGNKIKNVGKMQTPAGAWGDVGAATTPLLLALACAPGRGELAQESYGLILASTGYIPPGVQQQGERGALLIQRR
jgi:3-oxoacyl-[acyl-carrier-protein] synthase-1